MHQNSNHRDFLEASASKCQVQSSILEFMKSILVQVLRLNYRERSVLSFTFSHQKHGYLKGTDICMDLVPS